MADADVEFIAVSGGGKRTKGAHDDEGRLSLRPQKKKKPTAEKETPQQQQQQQKKKKKKKATQRIDGWSLCL
jgi:hypothetical protein